MTGLEAYFKDPSILPHPPGLSFCLALHRIVDIESGMEPGRPALRDIQKRLNPSKARPDELPLLTAAVRKTKGRPKKLFVDYIFLSALQKLPSHSASDKPAHQ